MTHGTWPNAVSFDPEGGAARIWEETLATPGEPVHSMLLISGEAARYSGWSARAVIALADELAIRQPVLLVDLHFDQPELDGLAGGRAGGGVADAILFGASLSHVAVRPESQRFELVPTGGPVPDVEAVFRNDAWHRLIEEANRRGAALLLYAPWRARGIEGLVGVVQRAVMLGGNTDTRLAHGYLPHDLPVTSVLAPSVPRGTPAPRAAPATPAPGAVSASQATADEPAAAAHGRSRWLIPLLVLAAVATAVVLLLVTRPTGAPPDASASTAAAAPPPEPAGVPVPFAVSIEVHGELGAAQERAAALQLAEPGTGFFVAPVLGDSAVTWRVMAGPLPDSATADARMQALLAGGHMGPATDWDVRHVPYTFLVGTFDTAPAAAARIGELNALGVPAYALAVPYSGGGIRHHVYSGAWAGPAEADGMRPILQAAGIEATLVQRIGRSIP